MGRDAADPCRGDGSRDPTLCLKTVVSTRGRPLCSLSLSPRPVAAILDRERDPGFRDGKENLDIFFLFIENRISLSFSLILSIQFHLLLT